MGEYDRPRNLREVVLDRPFLFINRTPLFSYQTTIAAKAAHFFG